MNRFSLLVIVGLCWQMMALMAAPPEAKSPAKKPATKGKAAADPKAKISVTFPPKLPDSQSSLTDASPKFLEAPATLREGVAIAKTPPTIDFLYYPGQDYPGKPWSNWGDSVAIGGKYYASIGDHLAPAGNAFVYEYDPMEKTFRQLANLRDLLKLPEGHYTPGKIHSRLDLGDDGWLYFSTHRGSTKVTADAFHYTGDWIVRCHPGTGQAEVVAHGPVPKHCIPTSVLDPKRLIYYGGTAPGTDAPAQGIQFFAYDVGAKKVLYSGPEGAYRYIMFAPSTGRAYYLAGQGEKGPLMRFDPAVSLTPEKIDGEIGLRSATQETPQGVIYTISSGQAQGDAVLWSFDTKTEKPESLGSASVGSQAYVASLDADPIGRYLYYVPGAHGGSERDHAAVVQYDVQKKTKKVIAFLGPYYQDKIGCTLKGTYSTAVDPKGDKLYVTWNASRSSNVWDCCALTVIHIPESEREIQ